jgi:hypothetical protein
MSLFYVTGSSANTNGSVVTGLGVSNRQDVTDIKPANSNLKSDGNKAVGTADNNTILQASPVALTTLSGVAGYVALQFGSPPAVGNVYNVAGASYPYNGTYRTISVSGNYALTSTPFVTCTGVGTYGLASLQSGDMDSDNQGDFVIMGSTDELAGQVNNALKGFKSNDKETLHEFRGYRSRVYAEGWQAFTGSVSKCDITTTDVTFNADEAITAVPTVVISIGTKTQSADLENPDTTGLRNPA